MYVTEKSDLFSLGTVFYEVLTGARPFESDDRIALKKQIEDCKVTPPSRRNPALAPGWDGICLGLLRADPDLRYKSADELLDDLSRMKSDLLSVGPMAIASNVTKFRKGRLELNILVHVGGNGKVVYDAPNGLSASFDPGKVFAPSEDVVLATEQMIQDKLKAKPSIYNGNQVRIDDYKYDITPDSRQLQYPLRLETSVTNYFATQRTNDSMRRLLANGKTIREEHGGDPNEYHKSMLSNPLAINLSVVTADGQIFIARRGKKTGNNPGIWAAAVSGTTDPDVDCQDGLYDPVRAAISEAKQEIFDEYPLQAGDVRFFGLARTLTFYFPFLFGEVIHREDAAHLRSLQPPGQFEIAELHSRPLTIPEVCAWARELYHERGTDGYWTVSAHAAIFSILQSLIYRFRKPEEQDEIIRLLKQ